MSSRIVLGAVVASAALGLSAGIPGYASAAGPAAAPARWRVAFSHHYGEPGSYTGYWTIVAPSKTSAWAFGGSIQGSGEQKKPTAARLAGGRWRTATLPASATGAVEEASAASQSDIWAATTGGYILHWNGRRWRVAKRFRLTVAAWTITGITALSPTNVWVFGGDGMGPGIGTWHLHDLTWSRVTGAADDIADAAALSPSSIWGVNGTLSPAGALMHYNGTAWRRVRSGAFSGLAFNSVVPISRENIWLLAASGGGLLHLKGGKWTRIAVPARPASPYEIVPDGDGGLWALASSGTANSWVLHYSASGHWSSFAIGSDGTNINDLALIPGTATMLGSGLMVDKTDGNSAVWKYSRVG